MISEAMECLGDAAENPLSSPAKTALLVAGVAVVGIGAWFVATKVASAATANIANTQTIVMLAGGIQQTKGGLGTVLVELPLGAQWESINGVKITGNSAIALTPVRGPDGKSLLPPPPKTFTWWDSRGVITATLLNITA